jgi:hypothetical protein
VSAVVFFLWNRALPLALSFASLGSFSGIWNFSGPHHELWAKNITI